MRTIVSKLLPFFLCCPLLAQQQQIPEDKVKNLINDLATKSTIIGVQQESYTYAADTGAANAYAVTLSPAPTVVTGSAVVFKAANANTGASTLAVNGGTATAIKKSGSTALASGDIAAGQIVAVVYDGTIWQMVGGSGSGGACGSSNIPCTNTANSYTTGTQAITTGAPGTVGLTVKATNGGIATPAYVQSATAAPGNSTTIAMTFGSNVTAGNAIIAVAQSGANNAPPTGINDTLGNSWTLIQSNTGAGLKYVVYASYAVLGGPDTITLTGMPAGTFSSGVISEYSGVASASAVDVQTSFVGTNSSPLTVGPITTNQSDLIFSAYMIPCCNATMSASGYTVRGYIFNAGSGATTGTADKNAPSAGSQSITWTSNTTGQPSAVALIALKAASTTPQTADLQEWKDASGTVVSKVAAAGGPTFPYLTLSPTTAVSCSATNAGQFQYIQGNASTKDIVQICAHDASNVYAWRSIY